MARRTAFIYSDEFLSYKLGQSHPLQQRRLQMVYRLLDAYGALAPAGPIVPLEPVAATEAEIRQVHTQDFVEAVRRAGNGERGEFLNRYGLGPGDTPAFPQMYEAAALYAGGSVQAARLVLSGEYDAVFNVAGGLHHAHPDHASGFCTFNDLAMACHVFLDAGLERVIYVDMDVHHGDGVQACFYDDSRVLTVSLQEAYGRFYPGTGFPQEIGTGRGVGYSVNVPYYPYTEDDVWHTGFDAVVPEAFRRFQPQAVVLQFGADAHWGDPLAHLMLSSHGWMRGVEKLLALSEGLPLVVTGGGGYNLKTVARLWAMVTAQCAGLELPNTIPDAYAKEYGIPSLHDWEDAKQKPDDAIRAETRGYMEKYVHEMRRLMEAHLPPYERNTTPT
ncbi:MAG: acetoin utilization protein AcuC [Armatimonadaceae bacterium]